MTKSFLLRNVKQKMVQLWVKSLKWVNPIKQMKFLVYIFSVVFILGCSRKPDKIDLNNIRNMSWVFESGYKIGEGDYIDFETNGFYELKEDSVFRKKIYIGKITSYNTKNRQIKIEVPGSAPSYYYNHDYR
jgi:hypothetical protein